MNKSSEGFFTIIFAKEKTNKLITQFLDIYTKNKEMDKFSKYIDSVVEKALNEALEKKADEIVSEIKTKVETNEKLYGKQNKLDVAEPKGKIDAADFRLLRKKKPMKEYTMGDVEPEMGVEPYGNFDTEKVKVGKVKNVGYDYEKKVAKEFNEGKFLGQNRDGEEYWTDEMDRVYTGDFDFDYDEEEFDDYDSFMEKSGNQRWFQGGDQSDMGRRTFDYYRDKWGPLKLRKRKEMDEQEFEEGNAFSGALAQAKKDGKKSFEVDGKVYPVKKETNESRDKFDGRKSKVVGVYSNIKKQRMEEKWDGDVDVKQTGQYSDMSIQELNSAIEKLKSQNEKYQDDGKKVPEKNKTKMAQLYFAKRAKQGWKGKGKAKVEETFKLTESEIIDLIERLVKEQTENIEKKKVNAQVDLNKVEKKNKEVNDQHIKDTVEKMKTYLKDASKGTYEMNPDNFPKGNGELAKMDKKAYVGSEAVEEYIEDFAYPGMTNLVYDEIKPNDEWIEANLEGTTKTGNAQKDKDGKNLGNAVASDTGKRFSKNYKDNVYGAEQMNASYKRYPQPVDQAGEQTEDGSLALKKGAKKSQQIFKQLESENAKNNVLNEEISKMKSLVGYNKKTQ